MFKLYFTNIKLQGKYTFDIPGAMGPSNLRIEILGLWNGGLIIILWSRSWLFRKMSFVWKTPPFSIVPKSILPGKIIISFWSCLFRVLIAINLFLYFELFWYTNMNEIITCRFSCLIFDVNLYSNWGELILIEIDARISNKPSRNQN